MLSYATINSCQKTVYKLYRIKHTNIYKPSKLQPGPLPSKPWACLGTHLAL